MIGLPSGRVELHEVFEDAAQEFALAKRTLDPAIAGLGVLEHVGSTAVRGLTAKPIVDMVIGWYDEQNLTRLIHILRDFEYRYRGFRQDAGGHIADYVVDGLTRRHVHLVPYEAEQWSRYLAFRDYLRECNTSTSVVRAIQNGSGDSIPR